MEREKVANPNLQKNRFLLAAEVVALARRGNRNDDEICWLIHQLEEFLHDKPTNFNSREYPGRNSNYCNGCGQPIDLTTQDCPNGTNHDTKTTGICGKKPFPLERLLVKIGSAITMANQNKRTQPEISKLMKALQQFKDMPNPKKGQQGLDYNRQCRYCGQLIPDGDICGCPASLSQILN